MIFQAWRHCRYGMIPITSTWMNRAMILTNRTVSTHDICPDSSHENFMRGEQNIYFRPNFSYKDPLLLNQFNYKHVELVMS